MTDQNEQDPSILDTQPEISPLAHARSAYLGYAALAHLSRESIEEGVSLVESANDNQADKLRVAFSSVAQVLLEIKGLTETEATITLDSGKVVEAELLGVKAEAIQHSLHWVGRRYLASMVGSIDDLELHAQHIPAIVGVLIEMRGQSIRTERRTLDIEKLLSLRLAGLSTEEISVTLSSKPNRVKGAFHYFSKLVAQKDSIEERNKLFRNRLAELNLLQSKQYMTDEELDAHLPPKAPKNTTSAPRTSRRVVKQKAPVRVPISQETAPYVPHAFPDDLLPGETMAERRLRLRNAANEAE